MSALEVPRHGLDRRNGEHATILRIVRLLAAAQDTGMNSIAVGPSTLSKFR